MAGRTAGDTNSRVGSRGGNLIRTESEILNDPDIWNISDDDSDFPSDSDSSENSGKKKKKKAQSQSEGKKDT